MRTKRSHGGTTVHQFVVIATFRCNKKRGRLKEVAIHT